MRTAARYALGNARVRAMKSRLRTSADARRVRGGRGFRFEGLVAAYWTVRNSYPHGSELFDALLRLHEIENLKIAWRARVRRLAPERWMPLWRPLGRLQTLDRELWRGARTNGDLLSGVEGTHWKDLVEAGCRSESADTRGLEISWDRRGTRDLVRLARLLPDVDREGREIVLARARERDLQLARRGMRAYGMSLPAVTAGMALLGEELRGVALERLCRWDSDGGRLDPGVSRAIGLNTVPADWDALELLSRRRRRALCRRAFLGSPYRLSPAVAYLVLKEEELRGVAALEESEPGDRAGNSLALALAAGPLER